MVSDNLAGLDRLKQFKAMWVINFVKINNLKKANFREGNHKVIDNTIDSDVSYIINLKTQCHS